MSSRRRPPPPQERASPPVSEPNLGNLAATVDAVLGRLATLEQRASSPVIAGLRPAITSVGDAGAETASASATPAPPTATIVQRSDDSIASATGSVSTDITERLIDALNAINPAMKIWHRPPLDSSPNPIRKTYSLD
ncbi:uncharacterized protein LOC128200443 [Galleria mellonella]|uniref:Uncharacterized protein LOC128200443 n=1 Tax=Galleria mellonella TaxID=7137 RepID=A0ABM3MEH1_GALME|nr:uncharacterized protein LOC128200443 [Galleria mellonella]